MLVRRWLNSFVIAGSIGFCALASAQAPYPATVPAPQPGQAPAQTSPIKEDNLRRSETGERDVEERLRGEFLHKPTGLLFRPSAGWNPVTPQRLRESKTYVIGLERTGDARLIANISYTPLEKRRFAEVINPTADANGEFGEEHSLAVTIYGKERVSKPITQTIGAFSVTKFRIETGPFPEDQNIGMIYLFEVGTGENRYKIKLRANFPKISEGSYLPMIEKIVGNFAIELK
jgi:hypothetical protein